jgi:uncharacterized protein (TIGR00369 family)
MTPSAPPNATAGPRTGVAPRSPAAPMTVLQLQALLDEVFAAWVKELDLQVRSVGAGEVTLVLPVAARHVHAGGVLCGQTLMAAADTAMVLLVSAQLGGFRPMTTVQLQTSFLRPVPGDAGEVTLTARLLKPGRNLMFGEIACSLPGGALVAHATSTYALL